MARRRKIETAVRKIQKIAEYYGMVYEAKLTVEALDYDEGSTGLHKMIPGRTTIEIRLRG